MGKVELNIGIDPEMVEQPQRLGISTGGMDELPLLIVLSSHLFTGF
jgi:antitoxin CcdA